MFRVQVEYKALFTNSDAMPAMKDRLLSLFIHHNPSMLINVKTCNMKTFFSTFRTAAPIQAWKYLPEYF